MHAHFSLSNMLFAFWHGIFQLSFSSLSHPFHTTTTTFVPPHIPLHCTLSLYHTTYLCTHGGTFVTVTVKLTGDMLGMGMHAPRVLAHLSAPFPLPPPPPPPAVALLLLHGRELVWW